MRGSVLVTAKAPVAGLAKTRLAAVVGDDAAADLAAAALLDTLAAAAAAFLPGRRVLALAGDLDDAARADDLRRAVRDWFVVPQDGRTFGERLVDGHRQAHRLVGGPVVQIGMDTPQVCPTVLRELAEAAHRHGGPVLGPADDGGWWVLVTTHPGQAAVLARVPMSRPDTGRLTAAALAAEGHRPATAVTLRDVDDVADAAFVSGGWPATRFAAAWRTMSGADRAGLGSTPDRAVEHAGSGRVTAPAGLGSTPDRAVQHAGSGRATAPAGLGSTPDRAVQHAGSGRATAPAEDPR